MTFFTKRVLALVARIPQGKTCSYKEVARWAGRPRAYRAVGNILNSYGGMDKGIPCHRVIKSDGTLGGFKSGLRKKRALLRKEKIHV
ncbi:MAG: MGMT family protein [Candidatus Heimdallarchaeota archaeon]|nr:MGMT family protein [Candidatus Heimdallarchaeota archaeon]